MHEFKREFTHEFVDEFFANFVHEFKYEIRTNSYEFLHEKLVMLRMACTVAIKYIKQDVKRPNESENDIYSVV